MSINMFMENPVGLNANETRRTEGGSGNYADGGVPFDRRDHNRPNSVSMFFPEQQAELPLATITPLDLLVESNGQMLDDGKLVVVPAVGSETGPYAEEAKRFLSARHTFVTKMGWRPDTGSDVDRYDTDPRTQYYLLSASDTARRTSARGEFVCGMRMTPVDDLRDSMSWQMLQGNDYARAVTEEGHLGEIIKLQHAAKNGRLHDMTRLVRDENPEVSLYVPSGMQQLFGAALAETAAKPEEHPLWVFMVTHQFRDFLEKSGIRHAVLYSGVLTEGDASPSYFCVVDPVNAYNYLRNSADRRLRKTGRSVLSGARKNIGLDIAA